jgi:hypothetical protein
MKVTSKQRTSPCAVRKVAVLAAAGLFLIAAQTFAVWHRVDLEAHSADSVCKICLTVSGFTNANVGHADIALLPAALSSCETPYAARRVFRHVIPQRTRGPPIVS